MRSGSNAEFVCVREHGALAHMPTGMSFEDAGAVSDGAIIALACLRKADPLQGRRVVIYGASGAIGTAAVQLAKHFGAHVTAVCNTKNVELVRSLGADEVVDYMQEDFTRNGKTYDVIVDAVGKQSFRRCRLSLEPGGIYIETDLGFMWHVPPLALLTRWIGDKRVTLPLPKYTKENVLVVKELIEAGEFRGVIDRRYPLEDVVEASEVRRDRPEDGKRRPDGERHRPIACGEPGGGGARMRAVVYDRYGPPEILRIEEVEPPVPKEDEVLVKVRATTVTRTDTGLRSAEFFISRFVTGLLRPKRTILGLELAGEVEAVGAAVSEFELGDHVFGVRSGAHAELVCVREGGALGHMPTGVTFEEAAAVCDGAALALACLRKAGELKGKQRPRLRRVRIRGNGGRAARQALRSPCHGGLQHEERRARAIARRGRGRRLPAGGLHEERQDVRPRLRRGRQVLVPAGEALAEAGRNRSSTPTSGSCGTSRCWSC